MQQIISKIKTIFKSSCIMSCFVGHPVWRILFRFRVLTNWKAEPNNSSGNIDGTKKVDHILEIPGVENFVIFSRIIYVKIGLRINVRNKFQDQRRLSSLPLQGYPQRMRLMDSCSMMRLQRGLYGISIVRYLALRDPFRPKLAYFCT